MNLLLKIGGWGVEGRSLTSVRFYCRCSKITRLEPLAFQRRAP
jgi:hypothetical protein